MRRSRGDRSGRGAARERAGRAAVRAADSLDARLPVGEGGGLLRKAFPDHWSFYLGELALYSLVVLIVTGVYLTLFFEPSMTEVVYDGSYAPLRGILMSQAFASTVDISFDVRGGLLIRQMHHWAAIVFVAAAGTHLLRIFFTGAFRRPREVNWLLGVTLFALALAEGFAGYSLPDDLLSGTGLRIMQGIVLSLPVVGTYLQMFLFGGEFPGEDIIDRLYGLHILLLPGLLVGIVVIHLILVFALKHTQWSRPGRTNRNAVGKPMFPQFSATSAGLFLMVSGVLAALSAVAQINPVWTYGPYRPDQASTGSQPDWYVGFLEGALRLIPAWETTLAGHTLMWNVLLPAVVLPGALFVVLYAYPFLEAWVTGDRREHHLCDRPRDRPVRTGLGVAGIVFYGVLLLAGGNDVVAFVFHIPVEGLTYVLRVAVIVLPVVAYAVTKRVCLALQEVEEERLSEGEETGEVRQSLEGGYTEERRPLAAEERYGVLHGSMPVPEGLPGGRVRQVLARWYGAPSRPREAAGRDVVQRASSTSPSAGEPGGE
ncbi:cytochrome bc complex cytochrome b subunit [Streptomyces sp. NPDC096205]|uniref:cytochrome bc1 complex cytochrome b subunit n=1 Tax=Streptomyces sp. NPDC096205 TaxID=3366081 RepID=UPI0038165A1F